MDEPFGALDEINRKNLQNQIKNLQKDFNLTIVLVTHDIEEAFELGTRIVVMNNGNIEQIGTKEDYFNKFESPFVKDFLSDKLKSIYINDHKISLEQLQEII